MEKKKDLNRIKAVLIEKKKSAKCLAEMLGKDAATISKWCINSNQPILPTLFEIAGLLEVDPRQLINGNDDNIVYIKIPKNQIIK